MGDRMEIGVAQNGKRIIAKKVTALKIQVEFCEILKR
jgi:hypothetical protein